MTKLNQDAVDLADGLHSAAIHLLRALRTEDRSAGIGPAQLSALSVLVFGGTMSLGKLAAAEQVKPPTMVRIVHSLTEQGLVRIRADSRDRRRIEITASSRGRSLMFRARNKRVEALAQALSKISEGERGQLRAGLEVLAGVQIHLRQR